MNLFFVCLFWAACLLDNWALGSSDSSDADSGRSREDKDKSDDDFQKDDSTVASELRKWIKYGAGLFVFGFCFVGCCVLIIVQLLVLFVLKKANPKMYQFLFPHGPMEVVTQGIPGFPDPRRGPQAGLIRPSGPPGVPGTAPLIQTQAPQYNLPVNVRQQPGETVQEAVMRGLSQHRNQGY